MVRPQSRWSRATTRGLVDYFYTEEDVACAVEEAGRSGLNVTVHTGKGEAARNVISGGAAAVEHGFFLDEPLLRLMRERGTFLVGTDFHLDNWYAYGSDWSGAHGMYDTVRERLALAHRLGVKMAYGTDVVIDLPGKNRLESSLVVLQT
jgi:imidazolonepropionase-like amidohydrolase